jgi:uncharacterized protein YbjT (DUF2867 family)
MNKKDKIILVTGATGKQGGAVTRSLLKKGWRVRALTRNPGSEQAEMLPQLGAYLVKGDLNDPSTLERAVDGVYGVFSVQTPMEGGIEGEMTQGKNLANAAKKANVGHFVYSSVGSADRNTGIPHFESKARVEEYIKSIGLKATIFRPVYFMENFFMPDSRKGILSGTLALAMDPGKQLQLIAVADIGEFVSRAFDSPDEYIGKQIDLAGDELTGPEIADRFNKELSIPVTYVQTPLEQIRKTSEDFAVMYEWFNKTGYSADILFLRKIYPGLKTLKTWIKEVGRPKFATKGAFIQV